MALPAVIGRQLPALQTLRGQITIPISRRTLIDAAGDSLAPSNWPFDPATDHLRSGYAIKALFGDFMPVD